MQEVKQQTQPEESGNRTLDNVQVQALVEPNPQVADKTPKEQQTVQQPNPVPNTSEQILNPNSAEQPQRVSSHHSQISKSLNKQEGTLSLQSRNVTNSRRTYKVDPSKASDGPLPQNISVRSSQVHSLSELQVISPQKSSQPEPHEMSELRRINTTLKKELLDLSERLDAEITRRLTSSSNKTTVSAEKELENSHRANDSLKREIKRLEKKVQNSTTYKIEELLNQIRAKDIEIESLKSEIKGLKKVKTFQEKGLMEAAGDDGLLQSMKENKELLAEIRKLQQRCQQKQRDLQKKTIPPKPTEVKIEDDRVPGLMKQIETLKQQDQKKKKNLLVMSFEKNRLTEENQELQKKIQEKDKEIQVLNSRITELRKCLKPAGGRRIKTLDEEHAYQNNPAEIKPQKSSYSSSKLQPLSSKHSLSKANNRSYRINNPHVERDSSSQKIVSTKLYKPTYPKLEERGNKNPKAQRFNDHQFSSRIIQIKVLLDEQNRINKIHAKYSLGEPTPPQCNSLSQSTFTCQSDEFVQYISGGFSDDFLDFIVFVTNQKRLVKYGVEKGNSIKFDFNIAENQYPVALFGEVTHIAGEYHRVNRIGCFIQEIVEEQKVSKAQFDAEKEEASDKNQFKEADIPEIQQNAEEKKESQPVEAS